MHAKWDERPLLLIVKANNEDPSKEDINKYLEDKGYGFIVNTFEDLTIKINEISKGFKSGKSNLPNITIGNLMISKELYEQIV